MQKAVRLKSKELAKKYTNLAQTHIHTKQAWEREQRERERAEGKEGNRRGEREYTTNLSNSKSPSS